MSCTYVIILFTKLLPWQDLLRNMIMNNSMASVTITEKLGGRNTVFGDNPQNTVYIIGLWED